MLSNPTIYHLPYSVVSTLVDLQSLEARLVPVKYRVMSDLLRETFSSSTKCSAEMVAVFAVVFGVRHNYDNV